MMEKMKLKMTTVLITALFVIIAIVTPVAAAHTMHLKRILVIAKGDDADITTPSIMATTSIMAMIEFDKASDLFSVPQVEFQTKIYDESGEKIYSMKGKLKDALVISNSFQFYCEVRNVTWINLWSIMGMGKFKTTDAELMIDFRGQIIPLPNTEGKYLPFSFWVMISPKGEYVKGEDPTVHIWSGGGWATVIILINIGEIPIPIIGAVTYLTKYLEI